MGWMEQPHSLVAVRMVNRGRHEEMPGAARAIGFEAELPVVPGLVTRSVIVTPAAESAAVPASVQVTVGWLRGMDLVSVPCRHGMAAGELCLLCGCAQNQAPVFWYSLPEQ